MATHQIAVSGRPPVGGSFRLIDHHGARVTDETYRGRFVLIFFGFTHCRVVCPRALSRLSAVLERLGPLTDQLQALYITVDPERDTPEVMRTFLEKSYPRFIGLTGTRAEIDAAKRAFQSLCRTTARSAGARRICRAAHRDLVPARSDTASTRPTSPTRSMKPKWPTACARS